LACTSFSFHAYNLEEMLSYSQIPLHKKYWWVVPELAARSHSEKIIALLEEMNIDKESIDTISVTAYPWLPWALVVWITTAYMLGSLWKKEVIEVNHIMGHVFSVLAERSLEDISFPYVCLTVSWWHNDVYVVEETKHCTEKYIDSEQWQIQKRNHIPLGDSIRVGEYTITKVAQSNDDAAWEAFDKVSRMLWWPYPWGKWVSEYWVFHDVEMPRELSIPPCNNWLFSLSWIKSQVYNSLRKIEERSDDQEIIEKQKQRLAYDFQEAVTWVSANTLLREKWKNKFSNVLIPSKFAYCTDNAWMIWVVGLLQSKTI